MASALAQEALDAVYDSELSHSANFAPKTGDPISGVRILLDQSDADYSVSGLNLSSEGTMLQVRRSEIPVLVRGDAFELGEVSYVVIGDPDLDDVERLEWTATLSKKK